MKELIHVLLYMSVLQMRLQFNELIGFFNCLTSLPLNMHLFLSIADLFDELLKRDAISFSVEFK
jgi:hypothetical protein